MIRDLPKCWSFLMYDGFKYHINVTEGLEVFSGEGIKVGKKEAGTSALNQVYIKSQAKQDKFSTSQIL